MGPLPPPQPQGLRFFAPWPWGIGEQQSMPELSTWRIDRMEGEGVGAGLRFLLQFDPGKEGFDRTLLGFSVPTLLSRLLGWSKGGGQRGGSMAITEKEAAAVSVAALATAVSLCLAAKYASDQRPRRARRRQPLAALAGLNSARPHALPAPDDGLRILSSSNDDASLENVIHGVSVGAGEEEPFLVARVQMPPTVTAGANAGEESAEEERRELERLRELWLSVLEREQRLELRLQELDGLREQEATVRELESRVAAGAMEARLLELKISSLQEENERLRAQVVELDAARAELARAKDKVRAIKARVQVEQEEARREAAALSAWAEELERGGEERASALAAEVAALRTANAVLVEENVELARRLQDAEQAASSVNLVLEEDMAEETKYLRETNETLTRQIEQLRSDHCAHVEELVYLKWVNACLRHEIRDHGLRPPSTMHQGQDDAGHDHDDGGLSALELSKSMSFRSSERAKQLMLKYGHPGVDGFDAALFSPLHESVDGNGEERTRGHSYEPQQSPANTSATTAASAAAAPVTKRAGPRKSKFLGNIKKLLHGGKKSQPSHGHGHGHGSRESRKAPVPSDEYLQKAMQWLSTHDVLDGDRSYESTPLSSCARTPLSSVTTVTARGGGGGSSERGEDEAAPPPGLARSKSDAGASYGREASRYHALRPDHPADAGVRPDGLNAAEKRGLRRRSEELRSLDVAKRR